MQEEADKQGLKDKGGDTSVVKEILDTWILQLGAYIIKQLWGRLMVRMVLLISALVQPMRLVRSGASTRQ